MPPEHDRSRSRLLSRRRVLAAAGATGAASLAGCAARLDQDGSRPGSTGEVHVSPAEALMDDPLEIRLSGFDSEQVVTVWARLEDDRGQTWLSYGEFETDADGALDVGERSPRAGTYDRADPNGLLWSLRVDGDLENQFIEAERYDVEFTAQVEGEPVDATTVTRRSIDPGVTVEPVADDDLVGLFFDPPGDEPNPGVLALHGSEGAIPSLEGAMLASRGYATLALQYFDPTGETDLPQTLERIPLEYGERALEWLLENPSVSGERVGVLGGSKGGELALLLGSRYPQVGCVIGYVPSGVVFSGLQATGSSWTEGGKDVPYVPFTYSGETLSALLDAVRGRPMALDSTYRGPLESPDVPAVREATIPVEEIDGPVLLLSGTDDDVWPSTPLAAIAADRLAAHDHPYRVEHHAYEGAGHLISIPHHPTTYYGAMPFFPGVTMSAGGTPAANAHAAADSWPRVLAFLAEGLR